jgi:peptide deformylase
MIYRLLPPDTPILNVELEDIDFDNFEEQHGLSIKELYDNLYGTMKYFRGIGLSANQCGISARAFIMYTSMNPENVEMFINPKIVAYSEERKLFAEGCLTFPNLFLNLKRPETIVVEYYDMEGEKQTKKFTGLTSRVFQHEYDHMQGKNFTMYASKVKLEMAEKKARKLFKKKSKKLGM